MSAIPHLIVESSKGQQTLPITSADHPLRLSELLRRKHLPLNTRCGQRSLCDGCIVELVRGQVVHAATGETLTATEPRAIRGCEYRLARDGAVHLRIPPRSLLAYEPQVVSDFKTKVPHAHDPLWQQIPIPAGGLASIHRRRPIRLAPALGGAGCPQPAAGSFATIEYHGDHWLITGLTDQPDPHPLGIAIDIGTTTVAILITDLRDGRVLAGAANFNKQMHLGDDVLTRINLCSTDPTMLRHLQELIIQDTLAPLITEALAKAGAPAQNIRCLTIAANTTMLHLFAGVDPSTIGVAPFTPAFLHHRILSSTDLPFPTPLNQSPFTIHLLPGAAAYVGADLTAGAFATGLIYDEGPALLVDVGTNGEIVLKRGNKLYGCATAAGPAFEGAGLTNGVRAADGAIAHIEISGNPPTVTLDKIGTSTPIGLCGTAYVDFLAVAREAGLLNNRGRIQKEAITDNDHRIIPWKDYGLAFRVAYGQGKTDIVITEADIANLLQAKGAIAAGILILLERIGLTPAQIKTLYLAGGFGLHLDRAHAIRCGLLPGFTPDQIEIVGNTSLAGAYLALLDCGALDEIARAGSQMEVIELNQDPHFEDRYIEQLTLPD